MQFLHNTGPDPALQSTKMNFSICEESHSLRVHLKSMSTLQYKFRLRFKLRFHLHTVLSVLGQQTLWAWTPGPRREGAVPARVPQGHGSKFHHFAAWTHLRSRPTHSGPKSLPMLSHNPMGQHLLNFLSQHQPIYPQETEFVSLV